MIGAHITQAVAAWGGDRRPLDKFLIIDRKIEKTSEQQAAVIRAVGNRL